MDLVYPLCRSLTQNTTKPVLGFLRRISSIVGLSKKCYKEAKEDKACFGERQFRGRMGKLLY